MKHLNINYITKSYMNDQDSSSPKETDNVTFVIFSNYALKISVLRQLTFKVWDQKWFPFLFRVRKLIEKSSKTTFPFSLVGFHVKLVIKLRFSFFTGVYQVWNVQCFVLLILFLCNLTWKIMHSIYSTLPVIWRQLSKLTI